MEKGQEKPAIEERTPGATTDRRAKPRFGLEVSVTLCGDDNFYVGLSENLSEGGLFVQTQTMLPIGTTIRIEFTLPTTRSRLFAVGEVRWGRSPNAVREEHNNYGSGAEYLAAGMGIQFKDLSPETLAAITKFVKYRKPDFYEH